jgi:hypothetical protein
MDNKYKGMHNGTVKGKSFEESRRNRKSHSERKMERAQHERELAGIK